MLRILLIQICIPAMRVCMMFSGRTKIQNIGILETQGSSVKQDEAVEDTQ